MRDWRHNVSFVLVEPTEPANVGASARAIKNMGFRNLAVVNPPEDPGAEAERLARNAMDVLSSAKAYASFEEAISGAALVIGSSRRTGKRRGKRVTAEEAALKAVEAASRGGKVAMLFGRERTGLYEAEIEECAYIIHIPADPRQPSLNLAQAVMVVAYELGKHRARPARDAEEGPLPTREQQAELALKFRRVLELIDYPDAGGRTIGTKVLRIIKHSLRRASLNEPELYSLNGICARLIKKLEK